MNSRIFALKKTFASCLQSSRVFPKNTYSSKPVRCDAHMNELPVPCGPWDDYYKERQGYYTKWLAVGTAWWLFSLFMMFYTDSVYFNWAPPALPGPATDSDAGDDTC